MPLRVYAIVGRRLGRGSLAAVSRAGLRLVSDGPTSAIVADCDAPPAPTARALRGHDAVVRRMAKMAPAVLPARFGSVVDSDAALVAILRAWTEELQAALRLVEKHEQMTLRVFAPAPARTRSEPDEQATGVAEDAGTRYLTRRAGAQAAPELEPLRRLLAPIVTSERIARHDRGPLLLTAYHLVPRSAVAAYRRLLRRHAASLGCRVVASGPWPPYAFVPELRG